MVQVMIHIGMCLLRSLEQNVYSAIVRCSINASSING
jgi:hypothetical protein